MDMLIAIDPGVRGSGGGVVLSEVLTAALREELGPSSVILLRHDESLRWILGGRRGQLKRLGVEGLVITGTPVAVDRSVPTVAVLQNRAVFDRRFRSPRRVALRFGVQLSARLVRLVGVAPGVGPAKSWVPIGLDPREFREHSGTRERADRVTGLTSGSPFILVPGSDSDYRDFSVSFEISRPGDPTLVFVGSGTDAPQFLEGLLGRSKGLGQLDRRDVLTLMCHAQAVVLTSLTEAYPVTALEAAAFGTPIIATDIPGHRLVLDQLSNVTFFAGGGKQQLRSALESAKRTDMRQVDSEWWVSSSRITPQQMARRYIDILEDAT